ncbi:ABC transporter G family member 11-like isoform X2 [Prunus yedoensis var. nudiflora]|uniref:ABC transporter G family member 11-like isoform X2 n=1 Tax=Prunus yedoensis var. nudiflora TaxID=2094558 RepID=A0A314XZV0_PRUYE|nr:ABC transporter G family member 11-like isoform X2 [Prunus yedoensis var. nudiflora]
MASSTSLHEYSYSNESAGIRTAVLDVETVGHNDPLPRTTTVTRSGPGAARNRNQNENHPKLEEGVFLTWEDLWVTVVSKAKNENGSRSRSILQGVTGYARPGELLAIMGPSGCGKSTLLDALGGRLSSNTRKTGKILINGQKQALAYGTSAYVTQDDTLITTLTVSEAVYYSAQLQLPDSMSKAEKKERAEITIREMGLQDAMNTRIGGWGSKGLSGGQKRRVSICIELLTRPNLLFLDEPTSGLDSAASYYVMSRIANLDKTDGTPRTVITSIHQPSSEVFQLFDNLCLLSAGRTVYFGPASAANQFFSFCGFPCPTLQNPSDHFLKTINKDFEQDIEQGICVVGHTPTEVAIDTLIKSYKASESYQQVQRQVAELCKQDFGEELEKRSHAGFLTQSFVLTRRSFVNMYRDRGYYWLRLAVYITIALGLGTVYQDLGHSYESIQARGSLIMFVSSFLTFMAIGGFPSFVEDMKVFERERLNGHYGVSAFVFANTFSSVPFLVLISVIPGAITYYVAGLHKGFEHFFYYACVLFACMMLVESLMMIVASIVPNFLMGIIAGAGIQGLMIMCGGFFRLPNDIPKPLWKFPIYYIAFHKYAYQGLFKNEFIGTTFRSSDQGGKTSSVSGEYILRDKWQVEMGYSKWVDLAILVGMILLYRVLFLVIIKATEKVKTITTLLAMPLNKRSIQVLVNPSSTPVHGGNL